MFTYLHMKWFHTYTLSGLVSTDVQASHLLFYRFPLVIKQNHFLPHMIKYKMDLRCCWTSCWPQHTSFFYPYPIQMESIYWIFLLISLNLKWFQSIYRNLLAFGPFSTLAIKWLIFVNISCVSTLNFQLAFFKYLSVFLY